MKYLSILAIVLCLTIKCYGQVESPAVKASDMILEGQVTGSPNPKAPNQKCNVRISVSKYPFNAINLSKLNRMVYEKEVDYNEQFKFIIEPPADRFYVFIVYTGGGWSFIDHVLMFDKGDRIYCKLSEETMEFSGKGSEKLQCQSEIYKLKYRPSDAELELLTGGQESKYVEVVNKKMDSVLQLQKAVVYNYSKKLGVDLTETMLANCYGLRYFGELRDLRSYVKVVNPRYDWYTPFVKGPGYQKINLELVDKLHPENVIASPIYIDFILQKLLLDQIVVYGKDQNKINSEAYSQAVFNKIKSEFSGIVRDKLIASFLLTYSQSPLLNKYLTESGRIVSSDDYRNIVTDLVAKNLPGSPFYDFELEDTNGRLVKLSDFDGKVVYFDFWYTGCIFCIKLKEALTPVLDKYKDNPNILFVSISIDKDRQQWINSVASGKYADPHGINLYTGGKGKDHPLIKKYNITAYPTTYLIKNGKIYSSPIPRPGFDKSTGKPSLNGKTGKLVDLIEMSLKPTIE